MPDQAIFDSLDLVLSGIRHMDTSRDMWLGIIGIVVSAAGALLSWAAFRVADDAKKYAKKAAASYNAVRSMAWMSVFAAKVRSIEGYLGTGFFATVTYITADLIDELSRHRGLFADVFSDDDNAVLQNVAVNLNALNGASRANNEQSSKRAYQYLRTSVGGMLRISGRLELDSQKGG